MNKNVLDGPVEDHKLEEVDTMDSVGLMVNEDLDGPVEGHKLEERMDIVVAMNKDDLYGSVQGQDLEDGEIAPPLDIVEVQEFVQGVIAATMDTAESMNNQALHEVVVVVQESEESEIAAMDIVVLVEDREVEDGIAAKGHGQEPDDCEIAAKSDHTVQQSGGIMRSKIKFTAGKADHTAQQSQFSVDVPCDSTGGIMRRKVKFTVGKTDQSPVLASKEKRKLEPVFVTKGELKGKKAFYLEHDDILMAVAVHRGKLELCLGDPSRVRSICRWPRRGQNFHTRVRVRMMCKRFQFLCRFLAEAVMQGSMELSRVDLAADHVIKKLPDYIKYGSIVGEVDGVEVLAIVGLHNPYRSGIDTTKDTDGELIAVSIVASGGYLDEYSSSGELIYIGSGGKAAGTDQDGDQKLERGNLALMNCIQRKIPVRVTHGFKTPNKEEGSHSRQRNPRLHL